MDVAVSSVPGVDTSAAAIARKFNPAVLLAKWLNELPPLIDESF